MLQFNRYFTNSGWKSDGHMLSLPAICCLIFSICFAGIGLKICNYFDISPQISFIIIILIFVSFCTLSIFIGRDFAGLSGCENNKLICKSRLSKINLPSYYCNGMYDCECEIDKDCATTCKCNNTTCVPNKGIRERTSVSKKTVNPFAILSLLLLGIVIFILLSKTKYFLLSLIPLVIIPFVSFETSVTNEYKSKCGEAGCGNACPDGYVCDNIYNSCICKEDCKPDQQCGVNNCGDSCGSCGNGYVCNSDNKCVPS